MPIEKLRPKAVFDEQRIEGLKQIAPECFADGKINWEVLKEALGDYTENEGPGEEHFGLFWPGKREARRLAGLPSKGTLVPVPGEGVDEDTTRNIFIEGENLEVLKLLQKSYAGRIKMIYIDPPYNTGNDFVYDDNFTETIDEFLKRTGQIDEEGRKLTTNSKADGRFHSKWLSMMYPRLRLAKNLLGDDGVIFVSIDDNEIFNLRTLMNEVFGEENFLTTLIWRRRKTQANLSKFVAPVHDYIVVFARNLSSLVFNRIPFSREYIESSFANPDNDPRGLYQTGPLARPANSSNREYILKMPNGRSIKAKWSCSQETFDHYVKENRLVIPRGGEGMPRIKIFLNELEGLLPNTWLDKVATNEEGSKEIENLFGTDAYFISPKPTGLIKYLLDLGVSDNDIVLDFFGGSGTTAHAVFDYNILNKNRKVQFILVQLDEEIENKHIARQKGYTTISRLAMERISRASKAIRKENKKADTDLGFKVLTLSTSNFKNWENITESDLKTLELQFGAFESPLIDNWKPEDLLIEILLIEGFPLDSKIEVDASYKKNNVQMVSSDFCEHRLVVCLDKKVAAETIKALQLADDDVFICLDSAITDEQKVTLSDKGLIKTI